MFVQEERHGEGSEIRARKMKNDLGANPVLYCITLSYISHEQRYRERLLQLLSTLCCLPMQ